MTLIDQKYLLYASICSSNIAARELWRIGGEEFENIYDLFATILTKDVNRQLKQRSYEEYISDEGDLQLMRGKLIIPKTTAFV